MSMANSAATSRWDQRFIELADTISGWSDDPATKVGAVLVGLGNEVIAVGYNGLPRGLADQSNLRLTAPEKYTWIEHAERNAIFAAARLGVATLNSRMYLSWYPCADCARAIVQAGIAELIAREPDWHSDRWGVSFQQALAFLTEAGVGVRYMNVAQNPNRKAS